MRNIKLTIAYLGTAYKGWQKNNENSSIEATLGSALERILHHPVTLQAASRTDAGVHAQGQVVNMMTEHTMPLPLLQRALNGTLPKDISILSLEEQPLSFHPTLDCIEKEYRYFLCNGSTQLPFYHLTSWHVPHTLDRALMEKAASKFLGQHDFSAFCNERSRWTRNPVCHLQSLHLIPIDTERFYFQLIGDHFLYKMVRNLIGTIVDVGKGKLSVDNLPQILNNQQRHAAGVTAPAHGLSLYKVYYPGIYELSK